MDEQTPFLIRYSTSRLPKQTPWHNWEEWEMVYRLSFGSIDDQREAITWIKLWLVRGNCPAAVESTAAFLELYNTLRNQQINNLSVSMLRHVISMALIRFVNGIVDQAQRAQFAVSVSIIILILMYFYSSNLFLR